jgi:hypothetical protein
VAGQKISFPRSAHFGLGFALNQTKEKTVELKRISLLVALLAVLVVAIPAQQPANTVLPATVKIESFDIENVKSDRVEMVARLGLYPERSFRTRQLGFFAMRINEIPVYVGSLYGDFQLKKGELLTLPDLHITVYYRDIPSLDPVRKMIQDQRAVVTGRIAADIDASPLEKIALRSLHPRIVVPFSKEIPVTVPGGSLGATAALAVLDMATQAGPFASAVMSTIAPGKDAPWRNRLATEEARHLVVVRTHGVLTDLDGVTTTPLDYIQLGFWISPTTVVVPAEAVRPWDFDADASAKLGAGASVDKKSVEITVTPLIADPAAPAAWSMQAKDFKVSYDGSPAKESVVNSAKGGTTQIRERGSANNYALLRFRDGVAGNPVKFADPGAQDWDRLGVLRLEHSSMAGDPKVEVVLLPGNIESKQIHLTQQIDDSAFGSPLFTANGVVGMVVDENFAIIITAIKHVD